jgi:lipopolysaccharide biosynthesis glycosyltransferase
MAYFDGDNVIPVVFVSNEYFLPYIAVAVQSIIENSCTEKYYRIYILHHNIADKEINDFLNNFNKCPNIIIEFINVSKYIKDYTFDPVDWSVEIYFKLLIPYIFIDYKKIILLDGDVICRCDLVELYDIDMQNHAIAGVRDIPQIEWYYAHRKKYFGKTKYEMVTKIGCHDNYFNSGVLLFNTDVFRRKISLEKLLDLAASRKWQFPEQDIFNVVFDGEALILPYQWNFQSIVLNDNFRLPDAIKQYFNDGKNTPKIVHFIAKPWKNFIHPPFFNYFWEYALISPYKNTIIKRMNTEKWVGIPLENQIYNDIKCKRNLGWRFILKCIMHKLLPR